MKRLFFAVLSLLFVSCQRVHRDALATTSAAPSATTPAVATAAATATAAPAPASPAATSDYWPADGQFPGRGSVSKWSGFRQHNAELRARFAAERAQDQDTLVFVGDSITEGWSTLAQDFADIGVKVANRGISGDTTPNLLYRLQDDVLGLHPRALVLLIGTNDLGAHTPPVDIAANLRELHTRIRTEYPDIPIAWCLVMPRGDGAQYPERIKELNGFIRRIAVADPRVTVCDTYTPLALPNGQDNPAEFRPDNLHLNATGYAVWREALHPIVAGWHLAAAK